MTAPVIQNLSPAPPPALTLAREALERFWECFWFRADAAPLTTIGEVQLIIRRLRQHGGPEAWHFAYQIEQCL